MFQTVQLQHRCQLTSLPCFKPFCQWQSIGNRHELSPKPLFRMTVYQAAISNTHMILNSDQEIHVTEG